VSEAVPGRGSRVRLHPRAGGDVFDLALDGQVAIVEGIEEDMEGQIHLAVTLENDPGRDFGDSRFLGHRFFFSPEEVEVIDEAPEQSARPTRVLVAGIGNVFLGDDGFGVELAARLAGREWPRGVDVVDFGIRGMDLAYALNRGYDAALLLDATPRGQEPGTLYVIEVDDPTDTGAAVLETHAMDPVRVLALASAMGEVPPRVLVLGCEPQTQMAGDDPDIVAELSPPVLGALDEAVRLAEATIEELTTQEVRQR
jgi:hydrogenase maturation protease